MCYVGVHMKFALAEIFNPNKVTLRRCPETRRCVTVSYTVKNFGKHMPVVQGICGKKLLDCTKLCAAVQNLMAKNFFSICEVCQYFLVATLHMSSTVHNFRS